MLLVAGPSIDSLTELGLTLFVVLCTMFMALTHTVIPYFHSSGSKMLRLMLMPGCCFVAFFPLLLLLFRGGKPFIIRIYWWIRPLHTSPHTSIFAVWHNTTHQTPSLCFCLKFHFHFMYIPYCNRYDLKETQKKVEAGKEPMKQYDCGNFPTTTQIAKNIQTQTYQTDHYFHDNFTTLSPFFAAIFRTKCSFFTPAWKIKFRDFNQQQHHSSNTLSKWTVFDTVLLFHLIKKSVGRPLFLDVFYGFSCVFLSFSSSDEFHLLCICIGLHHQCKCIVVCKYVFLLLLLFTFFFLVTFFCFLSFDISSMLLNSSFSCHLICIASPNTVNRHFGHWL